MKLNSFRLKIALLSGAITGGLLIATGVLLWELNYWNDLARIDRELRNLGHPELERVNGGDHWVRFERAIGSVGGTNRQLSFILWVRHERRVLHQSAHWPAGIDPESLPETADYEPPFVLAPGEALPPPPRREPITSQNPSLPRKLPHFFTREADGKTWRIAALGNPYMSMLLGVDLNEFMSGMTRLRNTYIAALSVALVLVAAGAWWLASRALRPVTLLTQTVERVTARGLDQRIPLLTHDREMERLITVFNAMMDRLEKSFHQASRFSADAAHELKTPLTIMQGEVESALQHAPAGSEQQRVFGDLLEEIQRLKSITQKLLLLSKADTGELNLNYESINFSEAVESVCEDVCVLGPELHVSKTIAGSLRISADPELLEQVLQNLANNALKYTAPGGSIRFELTEQNSSAVLRVANTGAPIPSADHEKIFERFFRSGGHNAKVAGFGLGLNLAREIVRAHRGELVLERSDAEETVFRLTLPLQRISVCSVNAPSVG